MCIRMKPRAVMLMLRLFAVSQCGVTDAYVQRAWGCGAFVGV